MIESKNDASRNLEKALQALEQAKQRVANEKKKQNEKKRKAENHHKYIMGQIFWLLLMSSKKKNDLMKGIYRITLDDIRIFVMREEKLALLVEEGRLKPVETRMFLENAFREGEVKMVGTDIDNSLPIFIHSVVGIGMVGQRPGRQGLKTLLFTSLFG